MLSNTLACATRELRKVETIDKVVVAGGFELAFPGETQEPDFRLSKSTVVLVLLQEKGYNMC